MYSQALINSVSSYLSEGKEGIPTIEKKQVDSTDKKDPKAHAHPPDPAVNIQTGSGIKPSYGAQIKYTNVIATEGVENSAADKKADKAGMKKTGMTSAQWEKSAADKKADAKMAKKMKESFNIYHEGVHYVFEKMDGKDDNGFTSCWKGYKKQGTKMKGDKEVNNCVKAGYEPIGELILDESAPPGAKYERMVKHIKKSLSKDGKLSDKDKAIAYATTWKAHNAGKVEECAMCEAGDCAEHMEEGEITRTPGKTVHTKTDFPGYPADVGFDDNDGEPKGRGRPRIRRRRRGCRRTARGRRGRRCARPTAPSSGRDGGTCARRSGGIRG